MDITQERLSEVIINSGLSHRELEHLTGISRTTIYRYAKKEVKKIPLEAVKKIAKATHTDSAYIMGWENEPVSAEKQALINMINSIDDVEKLKSIQKIVDALLK